MTADHLVVVLALLVVVVLSRYSVKLQTPKISLELTPPKDQKKLPDRRRE